MGQAVPIVYLSSDHAGVELRLAVAEHLTACGLSVSDLGPAAGDAVDYPDAAETLALAMREDRWRAVWWFAAAASVFRLPPIDSRGCVRRWLATRQQPVFVDSTMMRMSLRSARD